MTTVNPELVQIVIEVQGATLHEAIWRCLLAVAERESERP